MWIELTVQELISRVTGVELDALQTAATSPEQEDVLADIARINAAEWRGGLELVTTLSKRKIAVPEEVMLHVLADFRYRAFTRIPGMKKLLDDLRIREWERANHVRDHLGKILIEPPADDDLLNDATAPITPGIIVPDKVLD